MNYFYLPVLHSNLYPLVYIFYVLHRVFIYLLLDPVIYLVMSPSLGLVRQRTAYCEASDV